MPQNTLKNVFPREMALVPSPLPNVATVTASSTGSSPSKLLTFFQLPFPHAFGHIKSLKIR